MVRYSAFAEFMAAVDSITSGSSVAWTGNIENLLDASTDPGIYVQPIAMTHGDNEEFGGGRAYNSKMKVAIIVTRADGVDGAAVRQLMAVMDALETGLLALQLNAGVCVPSVHSDYTEDATERYYPSMLGRAACVQVWEIDDYLASNEPSV